MAEFSVIIPLYNHRRYIRKAVESVLGQTHPDLELIVIDDGSTDGSLEALTGIADPRLRIQRQENCGAHAAINRGLHEASGRCLAILNSDDAYHPQRLERALAVFNTDPQVGLVGSYIEIINEEGVPVGVKHGYRDCEPWPLEAPERSFRAGGDLHLATLTENFWSTTSNYVFRRAVWESAGDFRPLRYAHDWDFVLRAARQSRLELLPEPLIRYRVHSTNTIRENQVAMWFEVCWILAVHLPAHLAGLDYFRQGQPDRQVEQLLYSIHTAGLERVLAVMLLERLYEKQERALQLLNPQDPSRTRYLEFIAQKLAEPSQAEAAPQRQKPVLLLRLRGMLRRLRSLVS